LIAPPIILLDETEKFRDDKDKTVEIQTRGERKPDNIYFLVNDVSSAFELPRLSSVLLNKHRDGYHINKHYIYFMCSSDIKDAKNTITEKKLFLTYKGILRVLFTSHSNKADSFVDWATETLFTAQMGSRRARKNLAANILGIDADIVRDVFNKGAYTLPCIYLFTLGTAEDLRQSMNIDPKIDDTSIVAKFGYTKDLSRRTREHADKLGVIPNAELRLKLYSFIDPQFTSAAESGVKRFMNAFQFGLAYKSTVELVTIPAKIMNIVAEYYNYLGRKYMGRLAEYVIRLKDVQHDALTTVREKDNELCLFKKDIDLLKKDMEIMALRHQNEMKEKSNEILRLQLQLERAKN